MIVDQFPMSDGVNNQKEILDIRRFSVAWIQYENPEFRAIFSAGRNRIVMVFENFQSMGSIGHRALKLAN